MYEEWQGAGVRDACNVVVHITLIVTEYSHLDFQGVLQASWKRYPIPEYIFGVTLIPLSMQLEIYITSHLDLPELQGSLRRDLTFRDAAA